MVTRVWVEVIGTRARSNPSHDERSRTPESLTPVSRPVTDVDREGRRPDWGVSTSSRVVQVRVLSVFEFEHDHCVSVPVSVTAVGVGDPDWVGVVEDCRPGTGRGPPNRQIPGGIGVWGL